MRRRACPKHARLDSGQRARWRSIRCIVSASSMFSTRRALCGRALSSWKTKESPMATASVLPPMLIPPHTINQLFCIVIFHERMRGYFLSAPVPPYKNTSGVTL
ncbi:hypothetical protein TNCV_4401611 [Trichonephila clavipes]|nr:hypothetical protein TNCV_4401611 [Trichonephila clavipes]